MDETALVVEHGQTGGVVVAPGEVDADEMHDVSLPYLTGDCGAATAWGRWARRANHAPSR